MTTRLPPLSASTLFSSAEEIIDEARNGRMFILVDDEDRENEGDLVIAAQMATPDAVNFMARFGRGLICLALTKSRADQLGLEMMDVTGPSCHETAFTVSIEAKDGVTTGISAADRARTIATAIDVSNGPSEIVTPGHVFPLVARDGGVLVRAGHTEAAVDVARLAGLNASGVICEIMKDDGTMARLDDLVTYAQRHSLKMGSIKDLIAYRRRCDHLVERVGSAPLSSEHGGEWTLITYRNKIDGSENLVLQKGEVDPAHPTLVRMHAMYLLGDTLGQPGDRKNLLQRSMVEIGKAGAGVIVILAPNGNLARTTIDPQTDKRDYGVGAQILSDLGVQKMVLLTNYHRPLVALAGYDLDIVGEQRIPESLADVPPLPEQ